MSARSSISICDKLDGESHGTTRPPEPGILTVEPGEGLDDLADPLGQRLLRELDLPRVEGADTADLEAGSDLGRQAALRPAQDDVDELLGRRHRRDVLERGPHVGGLFCCRGLLMGW